MNQVLLKGNLTHDPYYDTVGQESIPFLRFYLAVNSNSLCTTILKGNVTQAPYFDRFGEDDRSFLCMYVAVNRPGAKENGRRQTADFIRVVAYDDIALFAYPFLKSGSSVVVTGKLRARRRRQPGGQSTTVIEVVADEDITFVDKIEWARGQAEVERILTERDGNGPVYKVVHGGGFIRVVAYRKLARISYPYLQQGSLVFVHGRVQVRKWTNKREREVTTVEVVARDITFLRKVNREAGDAARDRYQEEQEQAA